MTKTKTITAALAALTLATAFAATSGEAQAHPRWGWAVGAGVVTGAILGTAYSSLASARSAGAVVIAVQGHAVAGDQGEGRHAAACSTTNRLSAWRSTNAGPTPFTSSSAEADPGRRTAIDRRAASAHTV